MGAVRVRPLADGRFTMQGHNRMQHPSMGLMPIGVDVNGCGPVHPQPTPDAIPAFFSRRGTP